MNGESLHEVNELEWIKGKIFGNVFLTKNIVRINPSTGCVDGIMDASEIVSQLLDDEREFLGRNSEFVMNGIAFNPANDEIYLTGKNWKYLFKVKIQKQRRLVGPSPPRLFMTPRGRNCMNLPAFVGFFQKRGSR